jgi:hypothetical protein
MKWTARPPDRSWQVTADLQRHRLGVRCTIVNTVMRRDERHSVDRGDSGYAHQSTQLIAGGLNECVLAMGFEKMAKGSLGSNFNRTNRDHPLNQHVSVMAEMFGMQLKVPFAPQMFGNAGREHMKKYGTTHWSRSCRHRWCTIR